MQEDTEARKGKETDSPLEVPEGMNPSYTLDFSPMKPLAYITTKYKFVLFYATKVCSN